MNNNYNERNEPNIELYFLNVETFLGALKNI